LTHEANLALACVTCNRAKGSDIATSTEDGAVVELYHPRHHEWVEHFVVEGPLIIGRTVIGQATVRLLKLNGPMRLAEREARRSTL
jgi:hypothetical protein